MLYYILSICTFIHKCSFIFIYEFIYIKMYTYICYSYTFIYLYKEGMYLGLDSMVEGVTQETGN